MLTVQTSSVARAAIIARLADGTSGFNPRFDAGVTALGYTLPRDFRTPITFTPGSSKNFFTMDLEPADFESSTAYTLPLMTLFPLETKNTRYERPRQFAGIVVHGLNLFLTWPSTKAANELTTLAEAAQDALISTFNDLDLAVANWSQTWANAENHPGGQNPNGAGLVWGGDITVQFSRPQTSGDSWGVALHSRITLEVFTK